MKILIFSRFFAPHIGGVEKHIQKISEILLKKGFKVVLITEKFEDNLSEQENIDGIEVYRINLFKNLNLLKLNKFLIWYWLFKNFRLIKEADIVHCHDIFFWYLPFRFLFPKKPVYITFHGWEGIFPIPKRYILARKIWEKLAWGNICVGDYLTKWYGTKPNFITYGGIDCRNLVKKKENLFSKDFAFVGRLEKEKGILNFLELMNVLKKKRKKINVEFYGDGSFRENCEKWGKVHGQVYDIKKIFSNYRHVFTGGYLSSLEALCSHTAVFVACKNKFEFDVFDLSPFSDKIVIGEGLKILTDKVIYYLDHPEEERKIVEKGYNWARTQTWEKVADLYLKLWKIKR